MFRLCLIIFVYLLGFAAALGQSRSKFVVYGDNNIVLENARVVDVIHAKVSEGFSVLISNGKIAGVGKTGTLKLPAKTVVVDMKGKTILPGLVMLHEHMNYNTGAGVWNFQPVSFPKLFLAGGVTTLRTAG